VGDAVSYLTLLRQSKARRRESSRGDEAKRDLPEFHYEEAGALAVLPVPSADYRRLERAGYKPKISFGERVIWERPDTGFYYSEEMALHLLDAKNMRDKSGANAGR
jgi:hypothetical protein